RTASGIVRAARRAGRRSELVLMVFASAERPSDRHRLTLLKVSSRLKSGLKRAAYRKRRPSIVQGYLTKSTAAGGHGEVPRRKRRPIRPRASGAGDGPAGAPRFPRGPPRRGGPRR